MLFIYYKGYLLVKKWHRMLALKISGILQIISSSMNLDPDILRPTPKSIGNATE